jgi:hypothetical protein
MKYKQFCAAMLEFLLLNAKPELQRQIHVCIKQKYWSKLFYKCVIFRSKILQKLRIVPK